MEKLKQRNWKVKIKDIQECFSEKEVIFLRMASYNLNVLLKEQTETGHQVLLTPTVTHQKPV